VSAALLFIFAGYLAGSLPFGYWLVRRRLGEDIRRHGSGNIGASNVWRSFGARYGLVVVALDVLKGLVPALVASLTRGALIAVLAGAAAMLGHWRPLFLRFRRGGKMVATCGGAVIGMTPLVAAAVMVVWIATFLVSRFASLASILAALALIPAAILLHEPVPVIVFTSAAALSIVWLHRTNIGRLVRGKEHRFQLRRSRSQASVGSPQARTR
jgi:glycerol-3-phosphate acyltransferase PlsY